MNVGGTRGDASADDEFRLNAAAVVGDMDYPGSGLHPLKGDLMGHWAVKVSGNWRLVFRFENGDAFVVDCADYH